MEIAFCSHRFHYHIGYGFTQWNPLNAWLRICKHEANDASGKKPPEKIRIHIRTERELLLLIVVQKSRKQIWLRALSRRCACVRVFVATARPRDHNIVLCIRRWRLLWFWSNSNEANEKRHFNEPPPHTVAETTQQLDEMALHIRKQLRWSRFQTIFNCSFDLISLGFECVSAIWAEPHRAQWKCPRRIYLMKLAAQIFRIRGERKTNCGGRRRRRLSASQTSRCWIFQRPIRAACEVRKNKSESYLANGKTISTLNAQPSKPFLQHNFIRFTHFHSYWLTLSFTQFRFSFLSSIQRSWTACAKWLWYWLRRRTGRSSEKMLFGEGAGFGTEQIAKLGRGVHNIGAYAARRIREFEFESFVGTSAAATRMRYEPIAQSGIEQYATRLGQCGHIDQAAAVAGRITFEP